MTTSSTLSPNTLPREAESGVVELDWFAPGETVEVAPRDQKRFAIQKDRAIRILQLERSQETQLTLQLSLLQDQLGAWLREHESEVEMAYLTLRDSQFLFLAISRTPSCSDELEDSVSELDFGIANDPDLNLVRLNALVLPPVSMDSLGSFLNKQFIMVFRGR